MITLRKTYMTAMLSLGIAAASQSQAAICSYSVTNEWNTGFTGSITITNNGTNAIDGWNVGWQYSQNKITSSWNMTLSGANPYSASALSWNSNIQPGQSVSFGFQGDKNGGSAEIPTVTGAVCGSNPVSSSSVASSKTSVASSSSSVAVSSAVASSVSSSTTSNSGYKQCNWYGQIVPLCVTTPSGWGYENNASCVALSTCSTQPAPYGPIGGSSSTANSSIGSSKSSAVTSSSVISSAITSSSKSSVVVVSSSSSSKSVSSSSSSSSSTSSTSSINNGERLDNPFTGATWYVNPEWQKNVLKEPNGQLVANYSTAVWMDRIAAIAPTDATAMGLEQHLDTALSQKANLILVVIYDLPNRDCFALASNGELSMSKDGFTRYKNEYITPIVSIFGKAKYKDLRIVAIVEPDSLPNLVTNTGSQKCQEAAGAGGYVDGVTYTLNAFYPLNNVYSYIDIGHSGWLGWNGGPGDNFAKATTFIGNVIKGTTHGVKSVSGFISNTANSTPLTEPFLDAFANTTMPGTNGGNPVRSAKYYEWNSHFSELGYVQDWRLEMINQGFPTTIGMLVDTSRNGWGRADRPKALSTSTVLDTFVNESRIDRRTHRGMWCNQVSGIGERPVAAPAPGVDAYVWIKPPGESDGASSLANSFDPNDPAKGFDRFCDPTFTVPANGQLTGAMADAPVAGRWFSAGFQALIQNAYPPLR